MNNTTPTIEMLQVAISDKDDITYTVRDVREETGHAILAGPFIDVEEARKHQQLHAGSRVYKEELY
tara:strand:- start:2212 stop:2409 length:198 start_codon:yes stop_codon:yes gene_type:complete